MRRRRSCVLRNPEVTVGGFGVPSGNWKQLADKFQNDSANDLAAAFQYPPGSKQRREFLHRAYRSKVRWWSIQKKLHPYDVDDYFGGRGGFGPYKEELRRKYMGLSQSGEPPVMLNPHAYFTKWTDYDYQRDAALSQKEQYAVHHARMGLSADHWKTRDSILHEAHKLAGEWGRHYGVKPEVVERLLLKTIDIQPRWVDTSEWPYVKGGRSNPCAASKKVDYTAAQQVAKAMGVPWPEYKKRLDKSIGRIDAFVAESQRKNPYYLTYAGLALDGIPYFTKDSVLAAGARVEAAITAEQRHADPQMHWNIGYGVTDAPVFPGDTIRRDGTVISKQKLTDTARHWPAPTATGWPWATAPSRPPRNNPDECECCEVGCDCGCSEDCPVHGLVPGRPYDANPPYAIIDEGGDVSERGMTFDKAVAVKKRVKRYAREALEHESANETDWRLLAYAKKLKIMDEATGEIVGNPPSTPPPGWPYDARHNPWYVTTKRGMTLYGPFLSKKRADNTARDHMQTDSTIESPRGYDDYQIGGVDVRFTKYDDNYNAIDTISKDGTARDRRGTRLVGGGIVPPPPEGFYSGRNPPSTPPPKFWSLLREDAGALAFVYDPTSGRIASAPAGSTSHTNLRAQIGSCDGYDVRGFWLPSRRTLAAYLRASPYLGLRPASDDVYEEVASKLGVASNVTETVVLENPFIKGKPKMWYPAKGSEAAKDIGSILQKMRKATAEEKVKLKALFKSTREKWMARETVIGSVKHDQRSRSAVPPKAKRNPDDYSDVVAKVLGRTSYGLRTEEAFEPGVILEWSNGSRSWNRNYRSVKKGEYVTLDANQILVFEKKAKADQIARSLPALPLHKFSTEGKHETPPELLSNPEIVKRVNPDYVTTSNGVVIDAGPFDSKEHAESVAALYRAGYTPHGRRVTHGQKTAMVRHDPRNLQVADAIDPPFKQRPSRQNPNLVILTGNPCHGRKKNPWYVTDLKGEIKDGPFKSQGEANDVAEVFAMQDAFVARRPTVFTSRFSEHAKTPGQHVAGPNMGPTVQMLPPPRENPILEAAVTGVAAGVAGSLAMKAMANPPRKYGLFEKQEDGSWKRLMPSVGLAKAKAVSFWQNALLAHALEGAPLRELRPLPKEEDFEKGLPGWSDAAGRNNPWYGTIQADRKYGQALTPPFETKEEAEDEVGRLPVGWITTTMYTPQNLFYGESRFTNPPAGAIALPKSLERQVMQCPAADRPEILKGIEKYHEFHGCFPPRIVARNQDHAEIGLPKVCVSLGKATDVNYQAQNKSSNKFFAGGDGVYQHKFGEGLKNKKGAKPTLITDPSGRVMAYLPSRFRVKDWIHH